ncbi:hypothetical protein [Bacillus cereus]|nr:hypothetical protein [Bacillus cereus]
MKLTDEELKKLPRQCLDWNGGGAVIINKATLKEICKELLDYRTGKNKS